MGYTLTSHTTAVFIRTQTNDDGTCPPARRDRARQWPLDQLALTLDDRAAATERTAFRLGHRPALDGVRGIAILLVMGVHGGLVHNGHVGVDVFFALSGFLITALLIEELEWSGELRLKAFYARRALRLLPALGAYLLFLLTLCLIRPAATIFGQLRYASPVAAVFYVTNWVVLWTKQELGLVHHTWSLSIEEQFYIVWPMLLLLAIRSRLTRRTILVLLSAVIVGSMIGRWNLWRAEEPISYARQYYRSDARMYAILTGCLVALLVSWDAPRWLRARPALQRVAGPAALVFLVITAALTINRRVPHWGVMLVPAATMVLVLDTLNLRRSAIAWLLESPPLRWVGRLSYSLYLWHVAMFGAVYGEQQGARRMYQHAPPFSAFVLMWAAAFVAAALSYYFVERPALRKKERLVFVGTRENSIAPSARTALS